jgi:SanA protein
MVTAEPTNPRPGCLGGFVRTLIRVGLLCLLVFCGVNLWMPMSKQPHIYMDSAEVPTHDYGIVLGTSKSVGKYANRHFTYRMDAAAALYKAGKVKWLLLSGDGAKQNYNEPEDMKEALLERGVPASACKLDPLGLRSDETFSRAKREFGIHKAVVISDDWHLPRCLMLADHYGIACDGFYTKTVPWSVSSKSRIREWFARIRMWGDFCSE